MGTNKSVIISVLEDEKEEIRQFKARREQAFTYLLALGTERREMRSKLKRKSVLKYYNRRDWGKRIFRGYIRGPSLTILLTGKTE